MAGNPRRAGAALLVVTAWSYPRRSGWSDGWTRWHVMRARGRTRRALCGAFPRAGALLRERRTVAAASRDRGPICLRCARWLASRGARPDRGLLIPFPGPSRRGTRTLAHPADRTAPPSRGDAP